MLSLKVQVDRWLSLDPNPETRNEIQKLWDNNEHKELERRLGSRIEFGTAGLRGRMEAGWSRMNDLIILQASKGLADYVAANVPNALERGLVVGHDHRRHSDHWAHLTAQVFLSRGFKVYFLEGLVHTPMLPFSVSAQKAACGVMITASHNPKDDNGYKVYWENAVQIISPHDQGIAEAILAISEEKIDVSAYSDIRASNLFVDATETLKDKYFELLLDLKTRDSTSVPITFVNTSMHGVSDLFVQRAFKTFGYQDFFPVEEQQKPDPEFPTVRFPNPEEKGALDLAIKKAQEVNADYVLAQDPDSDRFAAAEINPSGKPLVFTGDQLGSLFAAQIVEQYKAEGKSLEKLAMVASTVSSKMIESMASKEGFKFVECLTGFKFIGNTGLDLVRGGYQVPFGYEEAIGYMFGTQIRDKDGVAATVRFVELATKLKESGQRVSEYLQELYKRYGFFKTSNSYFVCNDPLVIDTIFAGIRRFDLTGRADHYPQTLAGLEITRVIDLTTGYDSGNPPNFDPSLPISSGHMIQFRAGKDDGSGALVLTLRTSGTEPKIKYYLEGSAKNEDALPPLLQRAVDDIARNWLQVEKYGIN